MRLFNLVEVPGVEPGHTPELKDFACTRIISIDAFCQLNYTPNTAERTCWLLPKTINLYVLIYE